jgi:peptidoglycan/LPS O-acetylase OafA/YrhL
MPPKNFKNIVLFEGLNGLRFFAAFLVVMHHAETIRAKNGLPNFNQFAIFKNGSTAVTFFFVLSGFLITYLLLKENFTIHSIKVKNFYIKRILRIWPLYYLLVLIGLFLIPFAFLKLGINYTMPYNFKQVWLYFIFFLPGMVTFLFGHHLLEPLWSIGVEEVFYLIWAPLSKLCKNKMRWLLVTVLGLKIILIAYSYWFLNPGSMASYLIGTFQFEAMAIGGLGAYFVFNHTKPFANLTIYTIYFQLIIYSLLLAYLFLHDTSSNKLGILLFQTPVLSGLFVDFLFLYLIIGVSLNEKNIFKIKSKLLSFLGEISYGIYMYHMLLIFGMVLVLKPVFIKLPLFSGSLLFYTVIIILVTGIAAVSKKYFENYFLKMRSWLK